MFALQLTLLSLFVSHSKEEATCNRTLAINAVSHAHVLGVPVRGVFVELQEKESLAREKGHKLQYVGMLKKCMYGTVDADDAQILRRHGFVQGLSNRSLFGHVERDIFDYLFTVMTSWW